MFSPEKKEFQRDLEIEQQIHQVFGSKISESEIREIFIGIENTVFKTATIDELRQVACCDRLNEEQKEYIRNALPDKIFHNQKEVLFGYMSIKKEIARNNQ